MSDSKIATPTLDDPRVLRYVEIEAQVRDVAPYRLLMWEDGHYAGETWRTRIACAFYRSPGTEPFMVSYFSPGMGTAIDSDEAVACALGCFTMRPGDTDSDWFADYTPEQLEWAGSYECESLAFVQVEAGLSEIGALPEGNGIQWLTDEHGCSRLVVKEGSSYTPVFRDLLDW